MPYHSGVVQNWDDLNAIWEHSFSELGVDPAGRNVFITEAHNVSRSDRERLLEEMFELFSVDSTFFHVQAVLALFAIGETSGCVIDSGEYCTSVYPVSEGYPIANCSAKLPYGGNQITEILARLLLEKGYGAMFNESLSAFNTLTEKKLQIATDIKQNFAYIDINPKSSNFVSEVQQIIHSGREVRNGLTGNITTSSAALGGSSTPTSKNTALASYEYKLPDGTQVTLSHELYQCTEKFFQPRLFDQLLACEYDEALPKAVFKSIMSCGMDSRKSLVNNIVLAGGSTMFKGFEKRLEFELKATGMFNQGMSKFVKVKAPSDRCNSIWLGGATLAGMSTFEERWITGQDYDEVGTDILKRKCPQF